MDVGEQLVQGSEQWLLFRWGLISGFTAATVYGDGRAKWKVLASILQTQPAFESEDTKFGLEYERPVLFAWARANNVALEQLHFPGICVSADPQYHHLAYSPDAILFTASSDGIIYKTIIEVKCKRGQKSCESTRPPPAAHHHVQLGMLLTGATSAIKIVFCGFGVPKGAPPTMDRITDTQETPDLAWQQKFLSQSRSFSSRWLEWIETGDEDKLETTARELLGGGLVKLPHLLSLDSTLPIK
jgi:hypothetical protein